VQVVGGNKHREGFIYKLTTLGEHKDVNSRIDKALQDTLQKIKETSVNKNTTNNDNSITNQFNKSINETSKPVGKKPLTNPQNQ
jgi:hypothetical protein